MYIILEKCLLSAKLGGKHFMNKKTDDRRVRKTKKALRTGMAALLSEKNITDISVRELTELVDLHRGTFYLHYRDIYDLYAQIQQEMVDDVNAILDKYPPEKMGKGNFPMIRALIEYCAENADMCKMMLGANGDRQFVSQLSEIIHRKCINDWMGLYKESETVSHELFGVYVVSGCIGVLRRWLENDMQQSPQELSLMLEKMAINGVRCLDASTIKAVNKNL